MKKTTRVLSLILAVMMIVSVFAACGSDNNKSSTPAPGNSNASAGDANQGDASTGDAGALDTSKEVELVLYVVSDRPAKQDEIDANFNKLFKEKLNCTIKVNWIGWAEYANKYPLLFSSGEKFDMAYSATWLNFASLAQKGAFKNLDELWPTYAPKNYERQSDTAKQQATVDGHYYCIPTLYATYSAYGPVYRTDLLADTDWDGKMENLADLEVYLQYVKDNTDLEPLNMYQSGSEVDDVFMYENGLYAIKGSTNDFLWIDPMEENPQLFAYYDYEKTPEFLEMMNRWNEAGYFPKSALSDTDSTKVQNGKAASIVHNIDTFVGRYIEKPEWGFKYANFVKDVSNMSFTQDAFVISNTSENPERAVAAYELITSDEEVYRAFYNGIEGVSYNIIDGQIDTTLDPDNYGQSALWAARTKEFNLPTYGTPDEYKEWTDKFDAYIQDGVGSQAYRSFVIDTTSIETEYAACQNVHQQYWWPLELGYTDAVTGLAEYKSKMEAAGIAKVMEVLQGQLDEYVANMK